MKLQRNRNYIYLHVINVLEILQTTIQFDVLKFVTIWRKFVFINVNNFLFSLDRLRLDSRLDGYVDHSTFSIQDHRSLVNEKLNELEEGESEKHIVSVYFVYYIIKKIKKVAQNELSNLHCTKLFCLHPSISLNFVSLVSIIGQNFVMFQKIYG